MSLESKYNIVTEDIVEQLRDIVGSQYVIYGDPGSIEAFSRDEIPDKHYAHMPDVVVRPRTSEQIAEIMKLANREMIPVTPRGAGSGMSGGAVPIYGGIVIFVDRMNEILELDRENMMIVVEPGVVANDINEYLKPYGLFFAGYPMSMETCYIGGNVAENAGGGKAVKYGVTSRYVLGLEVVTAGGEIVELGGKVIKDVTGYNMIQLMTGSEGTLGIFTKIILKLMPLPKYQVDLLCLFSSAADAVRTVPKIMTESGIIPTAIEFMDKNSVKAACNYLNETIDYQNAGAMLIITVDGSDKEQVEREYEIIGELCLSYDAIEVYVADNPTTSERVWKIRRNIGEAYNIISKRQSNEDIVVPPASIAIAVEKFEELSKKYNVMIPCFGHAGDGNLHARIVSDPSWSDEHWYKLLPQILEQLYGLTAELGGKISGEHGIGHKRKKYMKTVVSEAYLNMLRAVKLGLDPNNVLNPGKIFDLR
ncbi:MAG: FAD-binding oxidoreductase [Sedimentisphaeraceae bacterium JB056]